MPVGLSEIEMIKAKQKAKAALTDEDKRRKKIHDKARHSVSIISTKLEELSKHLIALSV